MNKRKNRDYREGYTLVEVIVVCVILAILVGVAAGGLSAYQRKSMFKKNNEYAQTMYMAAQTAFSQAKDSGQSEELTDLLVSKGGNKLTSSMIKSGAKAQMKEAEAEDARLYYYIFKENDNRGEYSDAQKMVYEMIKPYIYDADVLDATFCVEFDPSDGIVYSVLYNDRASDFHYGGGASTEDNNDISDRSSDARSEILLGYYGVDSLSVQAPGAANKNLMDDVKLVNGETLELTWQAKDPLKYVYTIRLYSADTKKLAAAVRINDAAKSESVLKNTTDENAYITCELVLYSYDKNGKQSSEKVKNVKFRADAVTKDGKTTCRLVLDAADLEAAKLLDNLSGDEQEKPENYQNTYSVKRLGIQGDSLYARMQVSGTNKGSTSSKRKVSSWKQTKTENTYVGSTKREISNKDKTTTVTCDVNNARHLFNIRFLEGQEEQEKKANNTTDTINYIYRQMNDLYWAYSGTDSEEQGIIQNKNVYDQQTTATTNKNFPAIEKLHLKNEYSAKADNTGKKYAITGLHITKTTALIPLGIFGENAGTIQSLEIKNSEVTGQDTEYVGMICGVNSGNLSDIVIDEESKVSGMNYVGGIAGSDITGRPETTGTGSGQTEVIRNGNERKYENLTNKAEVEGSNFVGGITGYIYGVYGADQKVFTLKKCENTGNIKASIETGICIGGIVGYNKKTVLEDCISTNILNEEEKNQLAQDAANQKLMGYFVGGIVGYDDGGTFTHCVSGSKDSVGDYVYGKNYVGGITGFHTNLSDAKENDDAQNQNMTVAGDLIAKEKGSENESSENNTNVIGEKYVGGVVSVVSSLTGNMEGLLKNDGTVTSDDIAVNDKKKDDEASIPGTVTGYVNRGIVTASDSYAGGITGYNTGIIEDCTTDMLTDEAKSEELLEFAKTYTKDRKQGDYVGGIVGYNNNVIVLKNVKPLCSITAGENYVGGVVGYNDKIGNVSTYNIRGGYTAGNNFVGGYIGINRNNKLSIVQKLTDESAEDQGEVAEVTLDRVEGDLYVGGCIGGNIIESGHISSLRVVSEGCEIEGTAFVGGYIGYNKSVDKQNYTEDEIEDLANLVLDTGNQDKLNEQIKNFKQYDLNADGTKEWIINAGEGDGIVSFAKISAKIYAGGVFGYNAGDTYVTLQNIISNTPIITTGVVNDGERDYSYAGGITGHITKKMELVECGNLAADQITSPESVSLGGLTELNEGKLKNCKLNSIKKDDRNQIGGLTGVNKGTIEGCKTAEDISISGQDEIGGLVYYNDGTIRNVEFDSIVEGKNTVGGIAAYNNQTIQDVAFKGSVTGNDTTGGIAGVNQAGAIINGGTSLQGQVNGTKVTGGIAGTNQGELQDVINSGTVKAVDEQTGGIAGANSGNIQNVTVTGNVDAQDQTGGIVGNNVGSVESCFVGTAESATEVTGKEKTGGIAGSNEGVRIGQSENHAAVKGSQFVGGIAGYWTSGSDSTNCAENKNYNTVQGDEDVGGVIGSISELRNELTISEVGNLGSVYGSGMICDRAGGIVGSITGSQGSTGIITISNAVNIGTVASGKTNNSAGIVGTMDSQNPTTLSDCRNYGLPTGPAGLELPNIVDSQFSGMIGQGNDKVTLANCFGVAGVKYPITNSEEVNDNGSYYFEEKKAEEEGGGKIEIAETSLYAIIPIDEGGTILPEETAIPKLFDGKTENATINFGDTFYYSPDPQYGGTWPDGEISIKFKNPVPLNSIYIDWGVRSGAYLFKCEFYNEDGDAIEDTEVISFAPYQFNLQPYTYDLNSKEKISRVKIILYSNIYNGSIHEIRFDGLPVTEWSPSGKNDNTNSLSLFNTYDSEKGIGSPLYVDGDSAPYNAYNKDAGISIASGLSASPLDESFNSDYSHIAESEKEDNLRYQMYQNIDRELVVVPSDQAVYPIPEESKDSNETKKEIKQEEKQKEESKEKQEEKQEEKQKELPEVSKSTVELPAVSAPEVTLADVNRELYLYNVIWQPPSSEEELAAISKYVVTVKESSDKKDALEQTYEAEPGQNELQIDLETFGGKTAEISVQAIVSEEESGYKDSAEGEKAELQIPERNVTVDNNNITSSRNETDVLSIEDFRDAGIEIRVKDPQQKAEGTYQLHAIVYSDQARTEMLEDLGEISMEGNLNESSHNYVGLNTDYAGRYIGIQVKATSEDKMNSAWSEEKMLKLPTVRLKVPELIEEQVSMPYKETQTLEVEGELLPVEKETSVEQNSLVWNPVNGANAYKIDITAPVNNMPEEQYHLMMTRSAGGDSISMMKLTERVDADGNPVWEGLPYTVVDYPNDTDQSVTRVYSYEFQYEREQIGTAVAEDGTSYEYQIPLKGYVECHAYMKANQDTELTYKLILPDITSEAGLRAVYGTDYRNYLYTGSVSITAVPEQPEHYAEANPLKWWRELDAYLNWGTKIEEQH